MRYHFTYRMTSWELWQLSMYYIYGSMVGVCNIIFTGAILTLTVTHFEGASVLLRLSMILGLFLFPVIQPLAIYRKAKKQADGMREDTQVWFGDDGIQVKVGEQNSELRWDKIRKISRKPNMIILFSDTTHGFVLTDRVLGGERESFYQYATSKMNGRS